VTVCHLTSTHPADDARIARESATLRRSGHPAWVAAIPSGYPKWQHPLKLLQLAVTSCQHDADVYHCHEPDALVVGLLHKLRGKRVVYDVHEHWPSELPHDLGAPQALAPLIDPVERWLARRADAVIAVSGSVGARFDHPVILPNYPDPATTLLPPPATLNLHAFSTIAANLHAFHGVPEALTAVDRLRAGGWEDAQLTLVGTVRAPLPPAAPVTCTGYLPQAQIPATLQAAGVGLVLLQPEYENIRIGLPNKLFSYMAAGVPVIASALPEIRQVVRDARCGVLVEPGNVDAIVEAACWLADHPADARTLGLNGQQAIMTRYRWDAVEERLVAAYTTLER
jgi:glycosyltransferase involved in cell wall biosynthesis